MNRYIFYFLTALLGLIHTSCRDESDAILGSGKYHEVNFSLQVPGASLPETYALNQSDENQIKTIEILLFDTQDKYSFQPVYTDGITSQGTNGNQKTFSLRLPEGTYTVVVLANARKELNDILSSIKTGDSKTDVLNKLVLSSTSKWGTITSSTSYHAIPMWGEISNLVIKSGMSNTPVSLARMLSKINVGLTTADVKSKFTLKSIRLYNYYNKGQISPNSGNWNGTSNVATAPTIPSSATRTQGPLIYDGTSITTTGVSSINEIYTFEAPQGTSSTPQNNTCLVIGGIYSGDSNETFYRIDFVIGSAYLSLLRNNQYNVNITQISGSGFSTADIAFKARSANITAGITTIEDGVISDVVFDGQYMLGVSSSSFSFTKEQRIVSSNDNKLTITTDYPSGWKIDKITDQPGTGTATWLKANTLSSSSIGSTEIRLLLEANSGSTTRKGIIHLSAGRMTYKLNVEQNTLDQPYFITSNALSTTYAKDGSRYSFQILGNTDWKIKSVTPERTSGSGNLLALQDSDNLTVGTIGTANTTTGVTLSFTTTASSIYAVGQVRVILESTKTPKLFDDKEIVLNMSGGTSGTYTPGSHTGWAGSNIYFDGNKLTFDGIGVTTHQNYQGLYFQWGSLYGISPQNAYSTSTILYPPAGGTTSGLAWTAIPRVDDASITVNRDRNYLYEITDASKGIGDICKYLTDKGWAPTGKWRMPTSSEFDAESSYTKSGSSWVAITSTNAAGQFVNSNASGYIKTGTDIAFFPAAGYRRGSDATLIGVGTNGYYWSSSPIGMYGYNLNFGATLYPSNAYGRAFAFSVRCVRE